VGDLLRAGDGEPDDRQYSPALKRRPTAADTKIPKFTKITKT
jgi:hypothetical protein